MALMTAQAMTQIHNATFSAVNASDTITPDSGLLLYVKVGGTATTITVVVPGNQYYSGTATTDPTSGSVTNGERQIYLPRDLADPSTGLITVQYSNQTAVTAALLKV